MSGTQTAPTHVSRSPRLAGQDDDDADIEALVVSTEEHAGCCSCMVSDWPKRCTRSCCPWLSRWLDLAGYEQALHVKDKIHCSLFVCAGVSLACCFLWAADVVSGGCTSPRPWLNVPDIEVWTCLYETLGAGIFFRTLCDCVQMIGNYDNEHRDLLAKKKQMMALLYDEVTEALRRAKENADTLFQMLGSLQMVRVQNHVKEYFQNVLPLLNASLVDGLLVHQPEEAARNRAMLCELSQLLGENLNEPEHLVAGLCKSLDKISWGVHAASAANGIQQEVQEFAHPKEGAVPLFWKVYLSESPLDDMSGLTEAIVQDRACLKQCPAKHFFGPIVRFSDLMDKLCQNAIEQSARARNFGQIVGHKPWIGCGYPQWSSPPSRKRSCCRCCMPRLLRCLSRLLCCGCCCGKRCCASALKYPKKLQVGCLWMEVISRLHERLIVTIILGTMYCAVYVLQDVYMFNHGCGHQYLTKEFGQCVLQLARQNLLLVGLAWIMPAMFVCLRRIHHLDEVFQIMADIRKLENIRGVVKDLEHTVRADFQKQQIMDALNSRVLGRIDMVSKFRIYISREEVKRYKGLLQEATEGLVHFLHVVNNEWGPADEWVSLSIVERRNRQNRVGALFKALQKRNFRRETDDPSSSLASSSGSATRILVQSFPVSELNHSSNTVADMQRLGTPPMRTSRRGHIVRTGNNTAVQPLVRHVPGNT